jgi:hypothetical protein
MSSTSRVGAENFSAALADFGGAPLGQRAAGDLPVADVAVGHRDELHVMPLLRPLRPEPPALNSASSGWAPKTMIRSLPSSAADRRPDGAGVNRVVWQQQLRKRHDKLPTPRSRAKLGNLSEECLSRKNCRL